MDSNPNLPPNQQFKNSQSFDKQPANGHFPSWDGNNNYGWGAVREPKRIPPQQFHITQSWESYPKPPTNHQSIPITSWDRKKLCGWGNVY